MTRTATAHPNRRPMRAAGVAIATLALGAGAACAAPDAVDPDGTGEAGEAVAHGYGIEALQRDTDAICDTGVVGVQVLARLDDGEPWAATCGVANLDSMDPVPENSHFRAGSTGKALVATVVLQLAEEGELSLDDTVEDHLPGLVTGNGHDGSAVTLRHLLQHTSGIADHTDDDELLAPLLSEAAFEEHQWDSLDAEDYVAVAMAAEPMFEPGEDWSYNNTGYELLGLVIEAVTGNAWDAEVTARVIEPLGMERTTAMAGPGTLPEPHTSGYTAFAPGELTETSDYDPTILGRAAGSLVSTPSDIHRFFGALLGGDLLEPGSLAEMRDIVSTGELWYEPDGPAEHYGLGLGWLTLSCGNRAGDERGDGDGYWHHGGDIPGYVHRNGFTDDGSRGVVISISTKSVGDDNLAYAPEVAAIELVDNALCAVAGG